MESLNRSRPALKAGRGRSDARPFSGPLETRPSNVKLRSLGCLHASRRSSGSRGPAAGYCRSEPAPSKTMPPVPARVCRSSRTSPVGPSACSTRSRFSPPREHAGGSPRSRPASASARSSARRARTCAGAAVLRTPPGASRTPRRYARRRSAGCAADALRTEAPQLHPLGGGAPPQLAARLAAPVRAGEPDPVPGQLWLRQCSTPVLRWLRCRHPCPFPRRSSPQNRCPGRRVRLPGTHDLRPLMPLRAVRNRHRLGATPSHNRSLRCPHILCQSDAIGKAR